jgi:hypothetical protein
MRPMGSFEGLVILACVALAALFGFACALNDNSDLGLSLRTAADPGPSPDEAWVAAPIARDCRRASAPAVRERATPPGLLAAVPGGLCLLI